MDRLKDKVSVVTGSSRGIGREIALTFAHEGAKVVVTYAEQREMAQEVVERIRNTGSEAISLPLEVRDRRSVRAALAQAGERFGGIDILVNNAGINKPADFDKISDEDWDDVLSVNLRGVFICCQEALPYLRRSQAGRIINISSVSGQFGGPRTAHYAASKAGVISLTQVLARFLASDNVCVNALSPGYIASEMAEEGLSGLPLSVRGQILLGRLGEAREVADAAVFLASAEAGYITGQTVNINGGIYF